MSIPLTPSASVTGRELTFVMAAYFLGCFTSGYYIVRWRTGLDLRREGSGAVGARNAGRVLGASGFLMTLLLDATKGMLPVTIGGHFGFRPEILVAGMVAVVVGHNWPVQLRFHGGKGIATSLGALLAFDPFVAILLLLPFAPLFALTLNVTVSGLLACALLPLLAFLSGFANVEVAAASFLAVIVLFAHHKNIRQEFARIFPGHPLKQSPMHRRKDRGS